MRLPTIVLSVLVSFSCAVAQDAPACVTCSSSSTQAASNGEAYLGRLNAVTGWARGRGLKGVIASGTMTRLDSQGSESESVHVTFEMRADRKFRMQLETGEILLINDAVGRRKLANSAAAQMLPHVALSQTAPYLPFFTDLSATNDPDVQVGAISTATINGDAAEGIAVHRKFADTMPFKLAREMSSPMRIWISEKTGLPVKVDFVRLATDNWTTPITYSLYYSGWQQIDGVLVPTQIDEGIEPRIFLRYRFSSVAFNSQIPDSDFSAGGAN